MTTTSGDAYPYPDKQVLAFRDIRDMNIAWRSVLPLAGRMRYAGGERVPLGEGLLFLEWGRIRLMYQSPDGTEKILWHVHAGCLFGETAFFDSLSGRFYCLCMTDCSVCSFSPRALERISREHPELLLNLLRTLSRKTKMSASQASSMCLDSVLVRICKFLSQRIVPDSNPLTAVIDMSRQEMANLLGMHRISLYRALRRQARRGLFGPVTGHVITILRPEEFYKLAEI